MLRLLFANSSSYTELVCIVSLLQRKANWQEKKGLFLASFPHLHSRRQSCFKPSNYLQFITVMTIVKGKTKKSFWTGLTSKEGCFCQRDCTQTDESPMGVQRVLTSLLLLPKGSVFLPSALEPSQQWVRQMPAPSPSSAVGTALPPGHRAGTLPPPHLWGSRPFPAPVPPTAVLLCPAEQKFLPPPAQAGEPCSYCCPGRNALAKDIGDDGAKVIPATLLYASQGC